MRSWLFAPGDSEKKMGKALASPADIVIYDLEDAVATENKAAARGIVYDFLCEHPGDRARMWVRVNPLDGPYTLTDLAAIMPGRPGGIMLPKVYGRQDVEAFDKYLAALEVANGIEQGSTPVIVLITETAEGMFHTGDYKGAPRVAALTWGAEDLADSIGAAAAGVPAIDTIQGDFRDLEKLRLRAEKLRREGYRGMLAIHPAQVEVINAAFTPSAEDIAEARAIVALFAANPGVGTIGYKGGMLDRPYLSRAEQLLAQVDRE
jgi:citrate lyase subunit beta/citryl-CoA lyase